MKNPWGSHEIPMFLGAEAMPSHCGMAWSDAKAARHWPGPSHALMALVA